MNFWNPLRVLREAKQKKLEEIANATNELLTKLDNPLWAEILAKDLIQFKKYNPGREYEIITGTESEIKNKGYDKQKRYQIVGRRLVAKGMTSEQIWELQRPKNFYRDLTDLDPAYTDFIEARALAMDKYEPIYALIAAKPESEEQKPMVVEGEEINPDRVV